MRKFITNFTGGFYQDDVGQYQRNASTLPCKNCNNGTFVDHVGGTNSLDCKVCPEGTNKSRHAGYRACFCLENYFRRDRFGKCELCPQKGLTCTEEFVTIDSGYYWLFRDISWYKEFVGNLKIYDDSYNVNTTSFTGSLGYVHQCPQKFKCENKGGDSIEGNCLKGYDGFMCTECAPNYFPVLHFCHECPKIWFFVMEMLTILVIVACFLSYLVYYSRRQLRAERSVVDITLARGKIVLAFYQIMGEYWGSLDAMNETKLDALRDLSAWLNFLQFNISHMFIKPSCFFPKIALDAYSEFLICVTVSLSTTLVIGIVFCLRAILSHPLLRSTSPNVQPFIFKSIFSCFTGDRILFAAIVILFVTYPSTCNSILTLYSFACESFPLDEHKLENVTYLRFDYSIDCQKDKHKSFEKAAYVCSVYIVAFPGILFYLLWKYCRVPDDVNDLRSSSTNVQPKWIRFLCENYKDRFWYWEIVELARKVLQTYIIILLGWKGSISIFFTISLAVLFLVLHASLSPMREKFEQNLQVMYYIHVPQFIGGQS